MKGIGFGRRKSEAGGSPTTRPLRIAYFADPGSPNGWYRAIGPMAALAERGHDVRQLAVSRKLADISRLHGADVVLIHRQHDDAAEEILRYCQRTGTPMIWDNDDDFVALPRDNVGSKRLFRGLEGPRRVEALKRMIRAADAATAPSTALVERFRAVGARRAQVLENYVRGESMFLRRGSQPGRIVIGWIAGSEHVMDREAIPLAQVLGRLLDAHPEVELRTIGTRLQFTHERYTCTAFVSFVQLPAAVAEFDIGLAPLADIPFNRARSNVKLKEYAILGIPWLASPVAPYLGLGEREGGRLVADDGWLDALERMVTNPRDRRRLGQRAGRWGETQAISARAQEWETLMGEVVAQRAKSSG